MAIGREARSSLRFQYSTSITAEKYVHVVTHENEIQLKKGIVVKVKAKDRSLFLWFVWRKREKSEAVRHIQQK